MASRSIQIHISTAPWTTFAILNRALPAADVLAMVDLPALYGDYNLDGVVDGADYTVWRDTLGSNVPAYSSADGDGDGFVDEDDFTLWRANFGETGGASGLGSTATAMLPEQTPERTTDAAFAMYLRPNRHEASAPATEELPEQAAANPDVKLLLLQLTSRVYRPEDTVDTPVTRRSTRTQSLELAIADDWGHGV